MDEEHLIVGHSYLVRPALDLNADAGWEAGLQPARFAGRNAAGDLLWNRLGVDGSSNCPMRWIGAELVVD